MQKIKLERELKITHDCGGEFTLPDYVPAIGRMLSAECVPSPEGVYLKETDGRGVTAELGGIASFRILYVPEYQSGDGGIGNGESDGSSGSNSDAIFGVTVPCDYDTAVMIGSVSGPIECRTTTTPENVFCRVTAPRKLQLRCRLGTKITVATETDLDPLEDIMSGMEVKRSDNVAMALYGTSARDLLCALDLSALPVGAIPVSCSASVNVTECKPVAASSGEYRCRGEIVIPCLYRLDGTVASHTDRVQFDELVAFDGEVPPDGASARTFGHIESAELHHDDSGSRVEVVYELCVEAVSPIMTSVISDAYSCTSPCAVEYDDVEYLTPVCCVTGNVSVNERVPKNAVGRVCSVSAHAVMLDASCERGRLRLSGELRGNVLAAVDGELDVVPFTVPWTYEPPISGIGSGMAGITSDVSSSIADDDCPCAIAAWGEVSVISASARMDGELTIDAELCVSATAASTKCVRVVCSATSAGESFPARDGFTVYYPAHGETVWDIAKHFHVPTSAVACEGNIGSDGMPAGVVVI